MSRERLTAALKAAAGQAGGGLWALETLGGAPGCAWSQETRSVLGRVKSPACLSAGEWRFCPTSLSGGLPGVRMVHEVGGIRLAQSEVSLDQCADQIAQAVCTAAQALGAGASDQLQAVVEGLAQATLRDGSG